MDIFKEANIAGMKLKNRIIRSATHERVAIPDEVLKKIYVNMIKGGVGAIITGYVGVHPYGRTSPQMPMFNSDEEYSKWESLIKDIKIYGTPIIMQLGHGGGKSHSAVIGRNALSPSSYQYNRGQYSDEMSNEEIEKVIESYVTCIQRAKEVGFDGVQIQAAHGYLLSEFLSPRLNKRKDQWGGSTEGRFKIIKEIFDEARKRVGNYPILIKISAYDTEEDGIRIEESIKIAKLLEKVSCDAIEISCGNDNFFDTVRPLKIPTEALATSIPGYNELPIEKKKSLLDEMSTKFKTSDIVENYNVQAAEKIKLSVNIPVIVVGGIRKLNDIQEIIDKGKSDFVALSRPFIIEPDIVNKMRSGKQTESRCINCSYCITVRGGNLRCYFGKLTQ